MMIGFESFDLVEATDSLTKPDSFSSRKVTFLPSRMSWITGLKSLPALE